MGALCRGVKRQQLNAPQEDLSAVVPRTGEGALLGSGRWENGLIRENGQPVFDFKS